MCIRDRNKRKKAEIQAFRDSYSKDGYDLMITIEGTRIRSYKNNAPDVDLRKNDVRGVFETERFFVFQLTGGILLPLKKDAFIKGDVEACRKMCIRDRYHALSSAESHPLRSPHTQTAHETQIPSLNE